ncbi:MAG: hypothetical protein WAK60_06105 [Sedimentisphaerales bacterium]
MPYRRNAGRNYSYHGWLLLAIFIAFSTGLLLISTPACSSTKTKKTQKADSSKTEDILYDVNAATSAAKRDFPRFLKAAWSRKADYGFKADDEQNDVSLAEPILVYGIDEDIVGKISGEGGLAAAVEPVGEWIYPVQVKKEYRTLFGVRLRKSGWGGTYLGNPYLAASLQGIRKTWASKDGDGFKLVSCIQPRSFFFIALHADKPNLTPVTGVSLGEGQHFAPPTDWKAITAAGPVLESLKHFWKENKDTNDVPLDSIK